MSQFPGEFKEHKRMGKQTWEYCLKSLSREGRSVSSGGPLLLVCVFCFVLNPCCCCLFVYSLEKAGIHFNLCRDLADKHSGERLRGRLAEDVC